MRRVLKPTGCRSRPMLLSRKRSLRMVPGACSHIAGEGPSVTHRVPHVDAVGCLFVFYVILVLLDAQPRSHRHWYTWRIIPGIYRRRPEYIREPRTVCVHSQQCTTSHRVRNGIKCRYRSKPPACLALRSEAYFCGQSGRVQRPQNMFLSTRLRVVAMSSLHMSVACFEVCIWAFCLRAGRSTRQAWSFHATVYIVQQPLRADFGDTWFCWSHRITVAHATPTDVTSHVRSVQDLKSSSAVPPALFHRGMLNLCNLLSQRSGETSEKVNEAVLCHGSNKQPRLKMGLDLQPEPRFDSSQSALDQFRNVAGKSTSGKGTVMTVKAGHAENFSPCLIIADVQCRTTAHQACHSQTQCQCKNGLLLRFFVLPCWSDLQLTGQSAFGRGIAATLEASPGATASRSLRIAITQCRPTCPWECHCQSERPQTRAHEHQQHQRHCSRHQPQRDGLTVHSRPGSQPLVSMRCAIPNCRTVTQGQAECRQTISDAFCMLDTNSVLCYLRLISQTAYHRLSQTVLTCTQVVACNASGMFSQQASVSVHHGIHRCMAIILNLACGQRHAADIKEDTVDPSKDTLKTLPLAHSMYCRTAGQRGVNRQLEVCCIVRQLWTSARIVTSVYNICTPVKALEFQQVARAFARAHTPKTLHTRPFSSKHASSRPGPKSGGGVPCRSARAIVIPAYFCHEGATGVKVAPPAVRGAEGGEAHHLSLIAPPKPHGVRRANAPLIPMIIAYSRHGQTLTSFSYASHEFHTFCGRTPKLHAGMTFLVYPKEMQSLQGDTHSQSQPESHAKRPIGAGPILTDNTQDMRLPELLAFARAWRGVLASLLCLRICRVYQATLHIAYGAVLLRSLGSLLAVLAFWLQTWHHRRNWFMLLPSANSCKQRLCSCPYKFGPMHHGKVAVQAWPLCLLCYATCCTWLSLFVQMRSRVCTDVAQSSQPSDRSMARHYVRPKPHIPRTRINVMVHRWLLCFMLLRCVLLADAAGHTVHNSQLHRDVGKKSYIRACARAIRDGVTTYQGRSLYSSDVPQDVLTLTHTPHAHKTHQPRARTDPGGRIKIFSWNCAGLGQVHDELLHWVTVRGYDIVILQETLWKFSNTWVNENYVFIHSGWNKKGKSECGLLVLISKKLVREKDVRFQEIIPGRLLRVHSATTVGTHTLDVIAAYQRVWRDDQNTINQRTDFWTQLSSALHEVAARSFLVLAGDFNVTCRTAGRHVGCGVPKKPHPAGDWQDWMAILEAHALVALNTFGSAQSSTFRFGPRQSQLDYICIKLRHADPESRRAVPLPACPIGRHISEDAARHFPIHAIVPRVWRANYSPHQVLTPPV